MDIPDALPDLLIIGLKVYQLPGPIYQNAPGEGSIIKKEALYTHCVAGQSRIDIRLNK